MVKGATRPPVEVVVATGYGAGGLRSGGGGSGGDAGASTSGRERRLFLAGNTKQVLPLLPLSPGCRYMSQLTAPFSFGSGTEDVGRTSHSFHHTPAWVRHLASTPEPISRKLLYEPGRCPAAPYRTAATYVVACSSSTWGSLNPLGRWFRVQGLRLLVTAYSLLACRYPCYLRCSPPDGLGFVWREKSAGGGGSGRGGGRRNAGGTWAL
jgi:hypothetical protein